MLYVIRYTDVSPDALRSSGNHTTLSVSRTPGKTNGSHLELTDGWLGTSNNTDMHAHGEFDEADIDSIVQLAQEYNLVVDENALRAWASSDDQYDFDIEGTGPETSSGMGWTMEFSDEDGLVIAVENGYVSLDGDWDGYGNQCCEFDRNKWTAVLDATGIPYDIPGREEHSSDGSAHAWEIVVAEADETKARAAMRIHEALADVSSTSSVSLDTDDLKTVGLNQAGFMAFLASRKREANAK